MNTYRPHWSYSQLNTLMQCPLQYKFRYVERREPEFVPDYFPFGTAVHAAHKTMCEALKEGNDPVEADALQTFSETWEVLGRNPQLRFSKGKDWDNLKSLGQAMVKVLFQEMPREHVIAVDEGFTVPLITADGEVLDKPLYGIFDLIVETDDGLCVVDLKTGARKMQQEDVDADLQVVSYLYAISQIAENPGKVLFRFDLITKNPKRPLYVTYSTERNGQDFSKLVRLFQKAEAEVQNGVFLPRRSWRCKTCSYRSGCQEHE
jgi:hypothetical protein